MQLVVGWQATSRGVEMDVSERKVVGIPGIPNAPKMKVR